MYGEVAGQPVDDIPGLKAIRPTAQGLSDSNSSPTPQSSVCPKRAIVRHRPMMDGTD
jgi:hypothetical protein